MTDRRLRLDDQLCFALYAATNAITRAYRPLLRELGITYPQYLTLMALWQHGGTTVGELARRLDLPAHALTQLLRRLELAGLLTRRRDHVDGRAVAVELTTAGRDLEAAAADVQRRVVCATGLTPEALAALRGELHDLVDDMRAPAAVDHLSEGQSLMTVNVPDTRRLAPEADPSTAPAVQPGGATLYERLGGCYGIAGAVDILVDRLFLNVKVNSNDKVHEHHGNPANAAGYKFLVTAWSIEAAGGPKCYIGHDMTVAHEHLDINTAGFDAVSLEIRSTLFFLGVPDPETEEFMGIIESYRPAVVTT